MLKEALSYIKYGNTFYGVEYTINASKEVFYVSKLKKKRQTFDSDVFSLFNTKDSVYEALPKNAHIALVINTEKVLTKAIASSEKTTTELVYKAFPNINLEDFYFQVLEQETTSFVSICRKTYIDSIIKDYLANKCFVTQISLGNISITGLKPFISNEVIQTSNTLLHFKTNTLSNISKTSNDTRVTYDINGLVVEDRFMTSTSLVLQEQLGISNTIHNFENHIWLNGYLQSRFTKIFIKSGGLFLLLVLLINFCIFNHYYNKVNELQSMAMINQSSKEQLLMLNESVSHKGNMVEDLLKSSNSKSVYYLNSIVHSLPNSIILSVYNYQPIVKRIKPKKPIEQALKTIHLNGITNNSRQYSQWISDLEMKPWIKSVDPLHYSDKTKSLSEFSIKIVMADE